MSADTISIRRELPALFTKAIHKGVLIALIEQADRKGVVELSINAFAKEIGVNRMVVTRVIDKLIACNIVSKTTNKTMSKSLCKSVSKLPCKLTFCNKSGCAVSKTSECASECATQRASECATNTATKRATSTRFIKPTITEIEAYCKEKGYIIDAQYFWNYYESVGWMRGKTKIKNWKQTLATWSKNNYDSRTTQIPTEDKYTARRGTDVGNHSEADYGGPF